MPLLWWRELRGMAVQPASTPLPPNVHVVYEVLCDEGPQTGRALERLLARRGGLPGLREDGLPRLPGRGRRAPSPVRRLRRAAEATRGRPSLLPGLGAGRPVPAAGRRALGDAARRPGGPTGAGPRRRPRRSRAAAALPEAEGPPVDAESAGGLTALLARLRAQAPPPPVGALAVTPLLEVTRTSLDAGGLERRAERHHPGGEIETLAVERAPLEPSEHEADAPARPVAMAQLGEVLAMLDAVHASFRLTATTLEGTRSWFVPAAPGLTMGSEHTWGAVVLAAGLADGTQVRRPKAIEDVREE